MLAVLFGELIISIIVYSVGKIIKSKKTTKIGLRLLKQGFITFALFNVFNISFSFGVHLKYLSFDD